MRFGSILVGNMREAAVAAVSGRVPVGTWFRIAGARSIRFAGIGRRGAPVFLSGAAAVVGRVFRAIVRAVRRDRIADAAPVAVAAAPAALQVSPAPIAVSAAVAPVSAILATVAAFGARVVAVVADAVQTVRRAVETLPRVARGGIRFPRILPRGTAATAPARYGQPWKDQPPCRSIPPPGTSPPPAGSAGTIAAPCVL